ncbi:unnamed protein product [Prunus armeniaca]
MAAAWWRPDSGHHRHGWQAPHPDHQTHNTEATYRGNMTMGCGVGGRGAAARKAMGCHAYAGNTHPPI